MISAKIIKDSIYNKNRLTTLELEYPRYIHAEFMTHRMFSRNAQSSRAIPVSRLIERVENSTWHPIFMKNRSGMAATDELSDKELSNAITVWNQSKSEAIIKAKQLDALGIHKQIVNRVLEPFSTIKVIVSATDFDNFFKLRIHPAAQQEICLLAYKIKECMDSSIPDDLDLGYWHLPYIFPDEEELDFNFQVKLSVARCARVSYLNHDAFRDRSKDIELYNTLLVERHMSPFEHQATPAADKDTYFNNFKGWYQNRYLIDRNRKI